MGALTDCQGALSAREDEKRVAQRKPRLKQQRGLVGHEKMKSAEVTIWLIVQSIESGVIN